jgi:AhpD family alkylhydroperoxidase
MPQDTSEQLKELNARFATLAKAVPQAFASFRGLMAEATKDGALPSKFKELIAVAIAVEKGCADCVLFHVANAKKHGATREELSEALVVCIEMGGGPGAVYASRALAAYDEIA